MSTKVRGREKGRQDKAGRKVIKEQIQKGKRSLDKSINLVWRRDDAGKERRGGEREGVKTAQTEYISFTDRHET